MPRSPLNGPPIDGHIHFIPFTFIFYPRAHFGIQIHEVY